MAQKSKIYNYGRSTVKSLDRAFSSKSGRSKVLSWIIFIVLALFLFPLVKKLTKKMFRQSGTEIDQAQQQQVVSDIRQSINSNNLTLTVTQARGRASALFNAMRGTGTDDVAIIQQLSKGSPKLVKLTTDSVIWGAVASGNQGTSGKVAFQYGWYFVDKYISDSLTKDDYKLIFAEFGLRDGHNLGQWLRDDLDSGAIDRIKDIFEFAAISI